MDYSIIVLGVLGFIALATVWNAGLENVVTRNVEALSIGADTRVLKTQEKNIKTAVKIVANVESMDKVITASDAMKQLRKLSKQTVIGGTES